MKHNVHLVGRQAEHYNTAGVRTWSTALVSRAIFRVRKSLGDDLREE
jgi:hypothetical protein